MDPVASAELITLSRQAVALGRALDGVPTLVRRSRMISFNARVAMHQLGEGGEPFSVVARELDAHGRQLDSLCGVAAEATSTVTHCIGKLLGVSGRLRSYERSLRAIDRTGDPQGRARVTPAIRRAIEQAGGDYAVELRRLNSAITDLALAAEQVESLAVRNGQFVAVNARIEAARHTGSTQLATLAEEMADVLRAMERVVVNASRMVRSARSRSVALLGMLTDEHSVISSRGFAA